MNDKELISEALQWANGHPNRRSGELMRELADALSARQPNDEGEYILRLIETIKQTGGSVEIHGVKIMPCDEFGRTAAVPDAATEARIERWMQLVGKGVEERMAAEAERDAALAAMERVRALHRRLNIVDEVTDERLGDACEVCCEIESYELTWPCPTVAALDGAPEPDVRDEFPETVAFIRENSESLGLPDRALQREVSTRRELTSPAYVLRGGVYLQDEHAGVLIDSVGNFSAKTKGSPRSLSVLLKAIAEDIDDDVARLPVEGEKP